MYLKSALNSSTIFNNSSDLSMLPLSFSAIALLKVVTIAELISLSKTTGSVNGIEILVASPFARAVFKNNH